MSKGAGDLAGFIQTKSAKRRQDKRNRYGVLDTGVVGFQPTWHYWALFRLLQISPSYWLAHQEAVTGLPPVTAYAEFDAVRRTYGLFGPVWETPFWVWWKEHAHQHFKGRERVEEVGLLKATDSDAKLTYLTIGTCRVDRLVLSIPLMGSRTELLEQVNALLVANSSGWSNRQSPAAYPVIKDKTQRVTVNEAIRTIQARALFGENLLSAGRRSRYARRKESLSTPSDDPRALVEMTSRHSTRARRWAENAARGRFLCDDKEPAEGAWPNFDFEALKPRLKKYAEVSETALAAIPESQRTSEHRYAGWNRTLSKSR